MTQRESIIKNLQAGAPILACGDFMRTLDPVKLHGIFISAYFDRLKRKYAYVSEILKRTHNDWNQVLHELLFRAMDVSENRPAFERLSKIVTFLHVQREQLSQFAVEAMLLGASGLLTIYRDDDYIFSLKSEFCHFARKYELEPMRVREWKLHGMRPYNHPVLRLSQIAALLSQKEFLINGILDCRTPEDVERLFDVSASEYWTSHFLPAKPSVEIPKRIGREKSHLLGINIVTLIQYAYGYYIGDDNLHDRALELAERLPAENNIYTRRWAEYGVKAVNAFESQALIQIATEYCKCRRCEECPVGRFILTKADLDK